MRTEEEVRSKLRPNPKSHARIKDNLGVEINTLPEPTVNQLEEALEERTLGDRRKTDLGNACGTERRTHKRRQSD